MEVVAIVETDLKGQKSEVVARLICRVKSQRSWRLLRLL